ncbi:MAG: DNA repair protein RadC [Candidatus Marinimicrobia bacterium]|nr:DNA repair protein RadC [Candidatus Neomarinimicrobiota bacterium]MCF7828837.1 DNA repair protein RadC [Candidatus Neomarinimicrobiota bacterium]MCF7880754.1 DNA repair protein RadC [Candidatus Neomarinimicrobiota bacterium]
MTDQLKDPAAYHGRITDWPEDERPREKLAKLGPDQLSVAELLAIVVGGGTRKITAVDLAKTMLKQSGSLHRLAESSIGDLKDYNGVGDARAITLQATFELARRLESQRKSREKISVKSPKDIAGKYIPLMQNLKHEEFRIIILNNSNYVERDVVVSKGHLTASLVHPREVFKLAIAESAAGIILLHNHPSGNPEPSPDDIKITKKLREAGNMMDIPVHDHIIIAGDDYTSFVNRGLI